MLNRPHAYASSSSKGLDPGLAHRKPVTLVYHCRPQHLTVPFNRARKHHIPSVLASGVQVLNEPHEIGQMNTARCHHSQQTRAEAHLVTQVKGLCPNGHIHVSVQNCPFHRL